MDLAELIVLHRDLYRDDPSGITHMVAWSPPTTRDKRSGELQQEPADVLGMNLSARLVRYLGAPEGYGSDFPWSRALWKLWVECRRHHRRHRGPAYWNGSLCREMVRLVVIRQFSVENAARILRYDRPEPLLREAFRIIERAMDRAAEVVALVDTPPLVVSHPPLPGLHAEECPACRKIVRDPL